jgi:rod shape determining protein RodA
VTALSGSVRIVTMGDRVRQFDWETTAFTAALVTLGLTQAYAAGGSGEAVRQAIFAATGLLLMGVLAVLDYRIWTGRVAWGIYFVALLGLVLVRLKGHSALGGQRWLTVGSLQIQPSEFVKLVIIVAVATLLCRELERPLRQEPGLPRPARRLSWLSVGLVLLITLPAMALIVIQPDLGTAMVILALALGMLYLAGASVRQMGTLLLGLIVVIPVIWPHLHSYQRDRLLAFLEADKTRLGIGYNLYEAKIAIGSGQLFGQGFLGGTQSQLHFLPSQRTDFIFAVLSEQFGLVGGLILLVLFAFLLWRLFRVASNSRDPFGLLLAGGVAVMFFTQVLVNVGMNLGVMPIAGIPLPFISVGGSSMWTNLLAIGLVQSVWIHRRPARS